MFSFSCFHFSNRKSRILNFESRIMHLNLYINFLFSGVRVSCFRFSFLRSHVFVSHCSCVHVSCVTVSRLHVSFVFHVPCFRFSSFMFSYFHVPCFHIMSSVFTVSFFMFPIGVQFRGRILSSRSTHLYGMYVYTYLYLYVCFMFPFVTFPLFICVFFNYHVFRCHGSVFIFNVSCLYFHLMFRVFIFHGFHFHFEFFIISFSSFHVSWLHV